MTISIAEANVIGSIIIDNDSFDDVVDILDGVKFASNEYNHAYKTICQMVADNQPVDVFMLSEKSGIHFSKIGSLAKNTPSAANITHYAGIVREEFIRRELRRVGHEISAMGDSEVDPSESLTIADRMLGDITESTTSDDGAMIGDQLIPLCDEMEQAVNHGGPLDVLKTGFYDLDELTGGFEPGSLIILAARPGMGKTALAMNIASNVSNNGFVFVSSMEMPKKQLVKREMASSSKISLHKIKTGDLDAEEWTRFSNSGMTLKNKKLFIDDKAALTVVEMKSRIRKAARKHGKPKLIVVDYLQLMRGEGENRTQEITKISGGLKAIAKEFDIPVIALSQLNRGLSNRADKRPVSSDLRESGAIEQDADVIVFIYRDEVYNPDTNQKGVAEIIIDKNRNGSTGKVPMTFDGQYSRFSVYDGNWSDPSEDVQVNNGRGFDNYNK
jgi:replicative DNA helicase